MRIGITGSSGLIGTALIPHVLRPAPHGERNEVVRIVRRAPASTADEIAWDPAAGTIDVDGLRGLDAVVHLAGAGIGDHRWTEEYRRTLLDSRVRSTTLLAESIAALGPDGPRVLVSGSAIGFYGDRGDELVDESSPSGTGFLADICRAWETATEAAESSGVRVAHIRTGIVLSRRGGALPKMLPLFRLGLGGKFGNGRQWMSWITIDDQLRAIDYLLTNDVRGAVNLTAPGACRNAEFAAALGDALDRPAMLPVPAFGPKLLLGGDRADALLFQGQRVAPRVLLDRGFEFDHAEIGPALRAVLGR